MSAARVRAIRAWYLWFLEGFVRILLREKLKEINYLGGIGTVEGSQTVVELGGAAGHTSYSKLGLGLGKPNPLSRTLGAWEFDSNGVDVKGGSGWGFGHCLAEGQVRKKTLSIVETRGKPVWREQGPTQTN